MLNVTDLGQGSPILWIHGYPLESSIFEPQLAMRGIRHIMPDLPGFGASRAAVGTMTIDDYARIALDVLDQRGITQAVFAGFSMGGYICMAAARLAPERFSALILIDTRETPDDEKGRNGRYESIEKVKKEGVAPIAAAMLPKMLTAQAPQQMRDRVRELMSASAPDGVISALAAMAERPDSTATLRSLRVPTLIVVGSEDPITPVADAQRMHALMPQSRMVVIDGAAHMANFEQPEAFNRAVGAWISTL